MTSLRSAAAFVPAAVHHALRRSTFATPLRPGTRNLSSSSEKHFNRTTTVSVLRQPPNRPSQVPMPSTRVGSTRDREDDVCFLDECEEAYRLPPKEIARLVDGATDPSVSLQPAEKKWIVLLNRPNLPSIAEVSAEELRLAGFRINANTYAPSRADYYIGMSMQRLDDPDRKQFQITGLPPAPGNSAFLELGYVRWSPDGKRFAFCIYDPLVGLELWMVEAADRRAVCLLPGLRLNAVCGDPFTWNADSKTIIAKFVVEDRRLPERPTVPRGPLIQENVSSQPAPARTFPDLLKDRHDRRLFEHYTSCQLGIVDVDECSMRPIGEPAAFRRASPSPSGEYILIDAMVPPYQYMMPAGRFPRKVEVWDVRSGDVVCVVAEIPLQDKIPIAFDGVGEGPRGIGWRSDVPASLYWAEAQDGGDPNREAEIRDCVFSLSAPFTGNPRKLASLAWRYGGVVWGSDSVALLSERRYKTRSARSYLIAPGPSNEEPYSRKKTFKQNGVPQDDEAPQGPCCARSCDLSEGEAPRRLVIDIPNWEDRYNDPGSVSTKRSESGKAVLRLIYPSHRTADSESDSLGKPFLMLQGAGASEDGDRPFVSLFDTVTGKKTQLWQSSPPRFEAVSTVLQEDKATGAPIEVLIRRENPKENPNFYISNVSEAVATVFEGLLESEDDAEPKPESRAVSNTNAPLQAITAFPHPAPELVDVQREIVNYERQDGVRLNASLYLPPGYDSARDGPLPVFIWAYPREFKSAQYAGQKRGSPYRFVRLARTPLYWLTRGYAILDGPEMPIIGSGDDEPNDTYVEQLVKSAEAAVDFLVKRGIGERGKIAIGGHSYGAFMTANLLAHAPRLFCCGIARSGAYNRSLTPFGFQREERTLWQARQVYQEMSPYMYANKIESPLLLIHGDADNNPGTSPMQSERMYQALKGHGKVTRYVNLPHEGHGYRARESVMHVLAEMTAWLDKYCKKAEDLYDSYGEDF